jgi:hypothetical protein
MCIDNLRMDKTINKTMEKEQDKHQKENNNLEKLKKERTKYKI